MNRLAFTDPFADGALIGVLGIVDGEFTWDGPAADLADIIRVPILDADGEVMGPSAGDALLRGMVLEFNRGYGWPNCAWEKEYRARLAAQTIAKENR